MFAPARPDPITEVLQRTSECDIEELEEGQGLILPDTGPGPMDYDGFPLQPFDCTTRVKLVVDVVRGFNPVAAYGADFDKPGIMTAMRDRQFQDLPPILLPLDVAPDCPEIKMSVNIRPCPKEAPGDPQTYDIMKIFTTTHGRKMNSATARGLCRGSPMKMKYLVPQMQKAKIAFYYLFDMLGGLTYTWVKILDPLHDDTDEAIDKGYDFIEAHAPRNTSGTALMRFIDKNIHKETSPIYGWTEIKVEKAVKSLRDGGVLAKVRKCYGLTLLSILPGFLQYCLSPLLPTLRVHSIVFLGENNVGKTPLAIILAFMLARYWITKDEVEVDPEVRMAPDLDFFRGDPGTKYSPFIFDDGDMSEVEDSSRAIPRVFQKYS